MTRDVDEFDREDRRLSPQTHHALTEMAAERCEGYDPYAFERQLDEGDDPAPSECEIPAETFDGPPYAEC